MLERRAGAIKCPKVLFARRTRKRASAILTARCDDQSCLGEFRERFPHEGSAILHFSARVAEGISLPEKKQKLSLDARCNRELNASRDIKSPLHYVMFNRHNLIQVFLKNANLVDARPGRGEFDKAVSLRSSLLVSWGGTWLRHPQMLGA